MEPFAWRQAVTPEDAAGYATSTTARAMLTVAGMPDRQHVLIKAGGVDLLDLMKQGVAAPRCLVDISRIGELEGVSQAADGSVRIGALTTLAELAGSPLIRQNYPALSQAAAGPASPQIRNRATLGGNLLQRPRCWYFRSASYHCTRKGGAHCFAFEGDNRYHAVFGNHGCAIVHPSTPATPLVAYGGSVEMTDARGRRRQIALEDFFLLPEADPHRENSLAAQEILTAVHLPAHVGGRHASYLQVAEKAAFDWPLAAVAAVLDLDRTGRCRRANIILGAVAPVPWRSAAAETALGGSEITPEAARAAARAAVAGAAPLSRNGYKLSLVDALVRRAVLAAAGSDSAGPG